MLKRTLSAMQWASIVLLSVGVGIVQIASQATGEKSASLSSSSLGEGFNSGLNGTTDLLLDTRALLTSTGNQIVPQMNQLLGLTAVCLACLSSGFASVFFEKQLKRPSSTAAPDNDSKLLAAPMPSRKTGLWIRNIQLSLFSLAAGSLIYVLASSDTLADFLVGFTPIVYFLVGLQILGGLLAALVIQYADNIAKSFSASISIILSFAASIVLFNYKLSLGIMIGGAAVIGATWLFSESVRARPRSRLWCLTLTSSESMISTFRYQPRQTTMRKSAIQRQCYIGTTFPKERVSPFAISTTAIEAASPTLGLDSRLILCTYNRMSESEFLD